MQKDILKVDVFDGEYDNRLFWLLQSVLGMIISWPLRQIFRAVWDKSNFSRIAVIIVVTLLLSALWSASRLSLFLLMTNESDLW